MNRFRQHRPWFVKSNEPPADVSFETLRELLEIPCVARWRKQPHFHRFSLWMRKGLCIMIAETRGGEKSYIVGYLKFAPNLPTWDPREAMRLRDERERRLRKINMWSAS
jgi:hypothetical protein